MVQIFSKSDEVNPLHPTLNMQATYGLVISVINQLLQAGKTAIDRQILLDLIGGSPKELGIILDEYIRAGWIVQVIGGPGHFPGATDSPERILFR